MLSAETYDLQYAVNELLKAENESHSSRNCVRFPEGGGACVRACVCVRVQVFLHGYLMYLCVCVCSATVCVHAYKWFCVCVSSWQEEKAASLMFI